MKLKAFLAFFTVAIAALFTMRPAERDKEESTLPMSHQGRFRMPSKNAPFWSSAVVAEPATFREPSAVTISPSKLPLVDHPSEVARLLKSGEVKQLNLALAAWFDADAAAARDWLAEQESLNLYQAALMMIVGKITVAGDPLHALEWAAFLQLGPEQEQAVFDAYAAAARCRLFSQTQLESAPLPAERIAELLSGAAGD